MSHDIPLTRRQTGRVVVALAIMTFVATAIGFENEDTVGVVEQPLVQEADPKPRLVGAFLMFGYRPNDPQQIEEMIRMKVGEFSSKYELTASQQKKLRLAAHNDVRRIEREATDLERAIPAAKDLAARKELQTQLNRLHRGLLGLHEQDSFFKKSLANVLTDDQMKRYQGDVVARLKLSHRSNIETALRGIERKVVLSIPQFEALVNLMLDEIPLPQSSSEYDEAVVKVQFARISESRLKPIFTDDQWPSVRDVLDQFQELEPQFADFIAIGPADALKVENRDSDPNQQRPAQKQED